jgi:CheY-like chemotaxis protein
MGNTTIFYVLRFLPEYVKFCSYQIDQVDAMRLQLPIYQHPALTVFIDDNQPFLDSLAFRFDSRFPYKCMSDAQQAIDWLTEAHHAQQQKEKTIRMRYDEDGMTLEKRSALLDLSDICKTVQNKRRFCIPAVVVVDYAMPHMNGIEFCRKIQHIPCKKVLLTGNADEKIAVEAFNNHVIDFFIKKMR